MLRRIFKAKGKKNNKGSSTPVPTTACTDFAPELGVQAITQADAHEHVNLAMVKNHEHDQEGSESTSSEHFSAADDVHSVDHGDRAVQAGEAPSMSFFQGSSNVKNINPIFNQVHGDATFIRFGGEHYRSLTTSQQAHVQPR
ncbi:hypothetical protein M378DRAFT_17938 [Amanita muscaria Koide BX008]|uniref:Uncharacterized protein n=1 Tax=Amanita muscaria (strain Koide BX008) TaxID=946122 RepID=A0A0C2SN86_AMAMK|nr:hypothetical protein M378DRAFT_17938 [Amanita muscaria Koide BX008]